MVVEVTIRLIDEEDVETLLHLVDLLVDELTEDFARIFMDGRSE